MLGESLMNELLSYVDQRINTVTFGVFSGGQIHLNPPGGHVGHLPQTSILYDAIEDETLAGTSSLLDNLNHIRYRISALEETCGSTGSVVEALYVYPLGGQHSGVLGLEGWGGVDVAWMTSGSPHFRFYAVPGEIDHNQLLNYSANEHIDWTTSGSEQIHPSRYVSGSGGGSPLAVEWGDVQVGDSDIATLDFDGADFNITESPDTEINISINDSGIDHDSIANTHNLTTDIDHNQIANSHNLTTDIDHDQLLNYVADEHIDWTNTSRHLQTGGKVTAYSGVYPGFGCAILSSSTTGATIHAYSGVARLPLNLKCNSFLLTVGEAPSGSSGDSYPLSVSSYKPNRLHLGAGPDVLTTPEDYPSGIVHIHSGEDDNLSTPTLLLEAEGSGSQATFVQFARGAQTWNVGMDNNSALRISTGSQLGDNLIAEWGIGDGLFTQHRGMIVNADGQSVPIRFDSVNQQGLLTVDTDNDRVGIGHPSPEGILHVASSEDSYFDRYSDDNLSPGLRFRKARGTISSPQVTSAYDVCGTIQAQAWDGTSWDKIANFKMTAETGGATPAGQMVFATGTAAGIANRVWIKSNGNVGIGATPSSYFLDVAGTGRFTGKLTLGGGSDPPYVLYDQHTIAEISDMVADEVPPSKMCGAVMYFNRESRAMEIFIPETGERFELLTRKIGNASRVNTRRKWAKRYYLDPRTGNVCESEDNDYQYEVAPGYELDIETGEFFLLDNEGEERIRRATKDEAVRLRGQARDISEDNR